MTTSQTNSFGRLLGDPRVDRTIAVIASLPAVYVIYVRLHQGSFDIVRTNLILQGLLLILTMVARRSPVRVTMNPWFWLLAFVATYWVTLAAIAAAPGTQLVPRWVSVGLSWLGLAIMAYARLSLGRNIGFVPAQRQLVMTGAYGVVRHPIYTAAFVNYVALVLLHGSRGNLVLVALGVLWFVVKSFVEERFLAQDPEYAAYMQRVRWRWIPGVA
jgi:protein-S-isoprenylcysteine O-methyltransferase Ste14